MVKKKIKRPGQGQTAPDLDVPAKAFTADTNVGRITGDHDLMMRLEAILGPQDDIRSLNSALRALGEGNVELLAERLRGVNPKGAAYSRDTKPSDTVEARVFTGHLQPANTLALLELHNKPQTIAATRDREIKTLVQTTFPHVAAERVKWERLLPGVRLDDSEQVMERFGMLTETEWTMVNTLVNEGMQDTYGRPGGRGDMRIIALEMGLRGAYSAVHVANRAVSILKGEARGHVSGKVHEAMDELMVQGVKAEVEKHSAGLGRLQSEHGIEDEVSRLIREVGNMGGLATAVKAGFIERDALTWPSILTKDWALGDKTKFRDHLFEGEMGEARKMIVENTPMTMPVPGEALLFIKSSGIVSDRGLRKRILFRTGGHNYDDLSYVAVKGFPDKRVRLTPTQIADNLNDRYKTSKYTPDMVFEMGNIIIKQTVAYMILPDK